MEEPNNSSEANSFYNKCIKKKARNLRGYNVLHKNFKVWKNTWKIYPL